MNNATSPCSDDRIKTLLQGEECDEAFRSAAKHLDSCTTCQLRIAELAADECDWMGCQAGAAVGRS
ncbi:MAG: hypothetical protein H8E66_09150 [Planctomycetes bacterium]|nr:hypothetical protein [Planctomycetota bacterium]